MSKPPPCSRKETDESPRPLSRPARPGATVRHAEPVGCGLGPAARLVRFRGARDDERRLRLVARQARPGGVSRRARRARVEPGGATPLPLNVDSERCYPDDPGGVAETVALLAAPARRAARSRTTTRPPAASTTSSSPPSESRSPRRRPMAWPSRWCSPAGPRTTSAASTTSTTRSRADRVPGRRGGRGVCAGPSRPRADRGRRRGGRRAGERPRAAQRADRRRARFRRRASGLDRRLAGRGGLRSAARGCA